MHRKQQRQSNDGVALKQIFGVKRASDNWSKELGRMQKWLLREETAGRMTG